MYLTCKFVYSSVVDEAVLAVIVDVMVVANSQVLSRHDGPA